MNDDFFIGWLPSAPKAYAGRSRLFVWVLALALPLLALLIVVGQRGFSPAVFEYGELTELEGVLRLQPAPMLQLDAGTSLLLVGAGKHAADAFLEKMEAGLGSNLDGKKAKLKGYLIYYDGKGLFELSEDSVVEIVGPDMKYAPAAVETLGELSLCGEIVDPKCFFGVMKPGEGKPHRSCAVRCIAGGIPPVLKVEGEHGESNYYLLKGPQGQAINAQVLDYVADAVKVKGQLELQGDWYVLKLDPKKDIHRERPYWIGKDEAMCAPR